MARKLLTDEGYEAREYDDEWLQAELTERSQWIQRIIHMFCNKQSLTLYFDGNGRSILPMRYPIVVNKARCNGTDGVADETDEFVSAGGAFITNGVAKGDVLLLSGGSASAAIGEWGVESVKNATTLVLHTGDGVAAPATDTSVVWNVRSGALVEYWIDNAWTWIEPWRYAAYRDRFTRVDQVNAPTTSQWTGTERRLITAPWPSGNRNVRVTADFGFDSVPPPLAAACKRLILNTLDPSRVIEGRAYSESVDKHSFTLERVNQRAKWTGDLVVDRTLSQYMWRVKSTGFQIFSIGGST